MWRLIKERAGEFRRAWLSFECASMAAAVAFYAALSLFPLMVVLIAGMGTFFRSAEKGQNARDTILETVSRQFSPEVGEALGEMLGQVQSGASVTGPVAGVVLLFTASLVFFQIDRGFNRIWEVRQRHAAQGIGRALRRMALGRLRSLTMLFGLGLIIAVASIAGLVVRAANAIVREWLPALGEFTWAGTWLLGLAVNVLGFFALYRFLSKEKVETKLCLATATGAGLLWEVGSRALGALSFGSGLSVYGVIGSFLLVQVWIYYNAMVLFAGAMVVRMLTRPIETAAISPPGGRERRAAGRGS